MPGRLKVRILNGRDFPIMDRASELTDAFVEIRFAGDTFKTDVCKKSLNPQWNSEWFKFEAEDEVLQDEPLDLRVLDYDTYSAHDAIGKVYIDLKPLLSREAPHIISGWFPIYDTMHGIRGELNVQVRVELFSDFNKFRQSSCGIQFFCTCEVPTGWHIQEMLGFVEELVVNDDPEYQWIDKIRTPRASNEARQRLFSKLSGELQRKMGVKVLEMGGDAILGYHQNFDLEGESGIVVRAIGTAVSLSRISMERTPPLMPGHISPAAISPAKDSHHHHHRHHHSKHHHHHYTHQQHHHKHHHHHHHLHKSNNQLHSPHHPETTTTKNRPHSSQSHHPHSHHHPETPPIQINKRARPKTSVSSSSTQSDDLAPMPAEQLLFSGTSPVPSPHLQTGASKSPPRHFRFSYSSSLEEDPSSALNPTHPLHHQHQQQHPQSGTDSPVVVSAPAGLVTSPFATHTTPQQQQQQQQQRNSTSPVRTTGTPASASAAANTLSSTQRLSESDIGSPPNDTSRASSENSVGGPVNPSANTTRAGHYKSSVLQQSIDMVEYPFFTMRSFPVGFIVSLGGVVSSRSVKLLDKIHNPEEPETRDAWWSELRTEIKAHASKLGCHAVLGYQEQTTICDDVIILSAMGTAAKVNLDFNSSHRHGYCGPSSLTTAQGVVSPTSSTPGVDRTAGNREPGSAGSTGAPAEGGEKGGGSSKDRHLFVDIGLANQALARSLGMMETGHEDNHQHVQCSLCHIPYSVNSLPFDVHLSKCAMCRKKFVPEILFTTIDPPEEMPVWSRGCLIQARLCRSKTKNKNSEQSAREVSDSLPFLEYEVHNQLINKLKIRGLNCLFGVKIQISIGENMMTAVATATGTFLGPLPSPPMPKISTQGATAQENEDMAMLQKKVNHTIQKHRERLMTEVGQLQLDHASMPAKCVDEDSDDDDEEMADVLLEKTRDKNTFVLVVDDIKDESVPILLEDWTPPDGFDICNTQRPPSIQADRINHKVQMFTETVRVHFLPTVNSGLDFSKIFDTILRRLCFKLRHLKPCSITDICFNVDLPDEDKVNVAVTGCCLSLHDPPAAPPSTVSTAATTTGSSNKVIHLTRMDPGTKNSNVGPSQTDDMMFSLDGVSDPNANTTTNTSGNPTTTNTSTTSPPSAATTTTTTTTTNTAAAAPSGLVRSGSNARHSVKHPGDVMKRKGGEQVPRRIELTPLNIIHNRHITSYLGYYNFFFIRESTAVREIGGIGGFIQSFLVEVLAIVRSHVMALGGNGMVAFNMGHFILDNNPHKNQGQCLINVSGDMVMVSEYDEDGLTADQGGLETTSIPVPSSSSST